jgi:hypothetical protein
MITSCHCGAIHLQLSEPPKELAVCNCLHSQSSGSLWSYYSPADVQMLNERDQLDTLYAWGDKPYSFVDAKLVAAQPGKKHRPKYQG